MMIFKLRPLHIPWLMLLFHRPLIIVSVQGYLMFINRVHLMLLILKQCLLPVYRFTVKQAGLIVIKRKSFRNHTLFFFLQRFSATSLSIFLNAYIFALKAANSVMIFQPSSSFIRPITFLFSPMVNGLFSSFEYPLVSNLFSTSLQCLCKNLRSYKQSCQYPCSIS